MRLFTVAALMFGTAAAHAAGPAPIWTTSGFANPESVVYASQQKLLYVSNVNGDDLKKDGNGFISQVSTDGKILKREWFRGLNAPKGLGYYYGLLYVADIDELLEIDTGNNRIKRRFKAPSAKLLNDVAVSSNGTVYVSDTLTNSIWRLSGDEFKVIAHDDALQGPNGLLVEKGQLVVASWGVITDGLNTSSTGYLNSIGLDGSRAVSPRFSPIPLGNLDGIVSDGKGGYIVDDFANGNVFRVPPSGQPELWLPLETGTADLTILGKQLLIPNQQQNTLSAYPLPK